MRRVLLLGLCWTMGLIPGAGRGQEAVTLHCARGNVSDYPDATLTLNEDGTRVVHVTFVGYRPSAVRADWSLRDCLRTAVKYDDSRDIVARLWYREPLLRSPQEPLKLSDPRKLMYHASTGKIVRR